MVLPAPIIHLHISVPLRGFHCSSNFPFKLVLYSVHVRTLCSCHIEKFSALLEVSWIFLQLIFLLGILLNFVCVCMYVVSSSFYICFHVNSSRESCVTHTFSLCLNKIWVRHPSSVLL